MHMADTVSVLYRYYFLDGLNCTWGNWTSFTSCSATCGDGIQYRERSLEGMDTENSRQWCAKKEMDIQTCISKPCKGTYQFKCYEINNVST